MKIYCQVTSTGLVPLYDSDYEEKKKLKQGTVVLCEVKRTRNYKFLKKFFALIRLTFDNLPHELHNALSINTEEDLLLSLKIDLGISCVTQIGGRDVYKEGSISFSQMTESEFEGFYGRCVGIILSKYLRGTNRTILLEEIERYR